MPRRPRTTGPIALDLAAARRLWLAAQRLDTRAPFGAGLQATEAAIAHLGYVQIDTINVIERCHHHILFARIPDYRRADLAAAQSTAKSVFEYWTHALAYVPTEAYRFHIRAMRADWPKRAWFGTVSPTDVRRIVKRIQDEGPLSIRDIDDDELVEKSHAWASRKPSKKALQIAFYQGVLTISGRQGMVKTYELTDRHFGWEAPPKAASEAEIAAHVLDRALKAQGVVSLESICHLDAPRKAAVAKIIEARIARRQLVPVAIDGVAQAHVALPETVDAKPEPMPDDLVHVLSPFDPLIIQRKRLKALFGYDHVFEAYVPKEKRRFGYFALPVLVGDRIAAAIDIKTDRQTGRLLIQQWTPVGDGERQGDRRLIEAELDRFARFQLADG